MRRLRSSDVGLCGNKRRRGKELGHQRLRSEEEAEAAPRKKRRRRKPG